METLYTTLGVNSSATKEEIKSAYRKMVFEAHPDRNKNFDRDRFDKIRCAYETLSDDDKKKRYDQFLRSRERLEQTIRESYQKRAHARPEKDEKPEQKPIVMNLTIFLTISEMVTGKVIPILIKGHQINVKIPEKSYRSRKISFLSELDGRQVQLTVLIGLNRGDEKLLRPNGDIYMETTIDSNMAALGGSEQIKSPTGEFVSINFKGGLKPGQMIRLRGAGAYTPSGKRGDLFVTVSVKRVIFSLKAAFAELGV